MGGVDLDDPVPGRLLGRLDMPGRRGGAASLLAAMRRHWKARPERDA
jgi:hypothetical protein